MKYTPEQSKIIKASTDDDLLVVAGAGSGKTMTMTSRIVSLIERGVPAESILGLTFTNKAASELLSRVSAAVASQSASGSWDPNRAFLKPEVSTYDAFFQSIVRQYGLLVGMDQGTQPLSEAGAVQLAANVVKEHLDSIFPRQSERLEEALAEEGQADSLGADGSEELGAFDTAVQQVLALSRALSNAMISRDCPSFEDAVGRVRAWDQAFIARLDALIGSEVVPEQAPSASSIKLPKRTKKDTDQTYADKLGRMRQHRQDYRLFQADRLRRLVRKREQLLTLVGYYQEAKRQAEMAEFSDFTLAAFQLVTRFPSIGAIYRRRFTHVFLDEYQDTSTTQALLLAAIFHPQNRSGAEEQTYAEVGGKVGQQAGPHRSAVTAVGDPFQSIYAWRGASPGAFATFLNEFGMDSASPQAKLSLSQTFRNAHLVLDAANHLTDYLRADHEPQGPRPSARLHEVDVQELLARDDADQGTLGFLGYQSLGQEVDGVVRFVKQANATYGQTGPSGVDKGAPHVAVLFRSKKNMPTYQQALEDAGLSVQVVGYSALFDRPEIEDLLALLRVLCDHTNSAALMRLLASPRFNLTPGDLTAFANLATRLNTESLYQALVQRGVVPAGLRGSDMSQAIRDHRDRLVPSVFLVDLLQQDDLPELLASRKAQAISPRGKQLLLKAAQVLAQAQAQSSAPLRQAVLAASRALGLDIDLVVAQALRAPTDPIDASSAKASLGAFFEQVDAYAQELPQGLSASLRGFVSWIDAMRQSPNEPTSGLDTHVDVVLMTIHQAKGLEWDAVAVVGMGKGTFPSSQGDHLKIELVDPQEASSPTPAYQSTARTWLTDPTAVPVPIRADAQILPQFPHDAPPEESLGDSLGELTLTSLEDEVFGDLRRQTGFVDDEAASSPSDSDQSTVIDPQAVSAAPAIPDYLTQPEEYGQRQHKDERRLAYVALTRARHDLLVTFSAQPNNANPALLMPPQEAAAAKSARGAAGGRGKGPGQSQEAEGQGPREAILDSASNFWKELHAYFASEATRVDAGQAWQAQELATTQPELLLPQGYFLGERAVAYEQAVTSQALEEAPALQEADRGQASGIWPIALSSQVEEALALSARQTAQSVQVSAQDLQELEQADDSLYAHAERILKVGTGRLGVQGDLLVRDSQALQAVGAQVQAQGAQSVTAIQARSGGMDERSQRRYWRSVVRPLPQVASPAAEAGTRFHAWAASFLLPQIPADSGLVDSSPSGEPVQSYADLEASEQMSQSELAGDAFSQSEQALSAPSGLCDDQLAERTRMVADLEANLQQPVQDPERSVAAGQSRGKARESTPASSSEQESRLLLWQERLAQSDWAQRSPVWVERPIVAAIAGQIVKGKLDAVFAGGLNPADQSKSFTIVDWKTGHKPLSQQERERKLAQLDLYRLLLSRKENKPLASIDACLYYVNEDDSSQRTIPAGHKSQSEIEAQVRAGLPEQSDND